MQSYVVQTDVSPSSEPIERSFFIKTKLSSNGGGAEKSAKRIASCRQNANQIEHSEGDGRRHAIAAKQQHAETPGQPEQKKTLMDENDDVIVWWWRSTVFFFFLLLPFIVFCFVAYRHKRVVRRQFYAAEHCKSRVGCALFTIQSTHTQTHRTYPTLHHIHRRQRHKRSATSHFCFFLVFPRKAEEYT